MKKCVSNVDFLGLGSDEKLCPISKHIHRRLDHVILVKEQPRYAPPYEGGSISWKKSRTNICHLDNQICFAFEKGVNNWNMDKFWPLIKWDGNEICWIHYAKKFVIHLLPRSTLKKKWKDLWSQNLTFSNPKFSHSAAHHFGFWLLTFLGLEFGFWMGELWNSLVIARHWY